LLAGVGRDRAAQCGEPDSSNKPRHRSALLHLWLFFVANKKISSCNSALIIALFSSISLRVYMERKTPRVTCKNFLQRFNSD
jgi:hypothetical protein